MNEEHRPGLGTQRHDVASAVVFFVLARVLVTADEVRLVLVDREAAGDASLRMA